jgi:putative peptide zinc metalloprotease protein
MPGERTLPALGGVHAAIRTRVRRRRRSRTVHAWEAIDKRLNPAAFRPKLRDDVEIKTFTRRNGEEFTMIKSPPGPSYMRLTSEEKFLLGMMDGRRTVKEIVVAHFQRYGSFSLSQVADLVDEMYRGNFFTTPYDSVLERALEARKAKRSHAPAWVRQFREVRRIESRKAYRLFEPMYRYGGKYFFTKPFAIVSLVISIVGVGAFVAVVKEGKFSLLGGSAATGVLVLYGIQLFSTFIHESGHALGNVHARRHIVAAGFMLYLGIPAFFIETTDMWMAERKQRLIASCAGPFSECIMAGAASILCIVLPASGFTAFLFRFSVLSYIAIGQNLIPFLRLDGYYIFMDALDVVNLRERSFEFLKEDLVPMIREREKFNREEKIFTTYGVLAVIFTVLAVGFSITFWSRIFGDAVRSAWKAGLIPGLLVSVLLFLIVAPLMRGVVLLARRGVRRARRAFRSLRAVGQKHWRREAVDLFRSLPLTEDLSDEAREEIADHVELIRVDAGRPIVRQGERGDYFYVVRSGTFEVSVEGTDGEQRRLRTLERGRSFGEVALLERTTRTATVRAVEPSQVFAIDKGTFDRVIAERMEMAEEMREDLRSVALIRSLEPFRTLDDADAARLVKGAEFLNFAPGARIVKQGDEGDSFFVVASGQVEIVENRRVRGRLGAGAYFGEVALLADSPRTATVRAATPARVLELDRKAFDRVLAKSFRRGRLAPSRALTMDREH